MPEVLNITHREKIAHLVKSRANKKRRVIDDKISKINKEITKDAEDAFKGVVKKMKKLCNDNGFEMTEKSNIYYNLGIEPIATHRMQEELDALKTRVESINNLVDDTVEEIYLKLGLGELEVAVTSFKTKLKDI